MRVVVIKNGKVVYSMRPETREVEFSWTDYYAGAGKTACYYVRGEQAGHDRLRRARGRGRRVVELNMNDGELVWTSPMWIKYEPKARRRGQ